MDELIQANVVNFKSLLLMQQKELKLHANDLLVLLTLLEMEHQHLVLSMKTLQQMSVLTENVLNDRLYQLVNTYHLLEINSSGILELNALKRRLLVPFYPVEKKEEKPSLMTIFENEFGRMLSPMEIETIKGWKHLQYDDEMITKALKEAVMANVKNFRYIDKILADWAVHGIRTSQNKASSATPTKPVEDIISYDWWEVVSK